jgi:adenylosuccinate synthase
VKQPEVIAVVGGQWGDEGKGKIVDYLATQSDVAIRSQGGDNAGHTVINDQGKFALHLIPAGIFSPDTINIIGPGVALNPKTLLKEVVELQERGVSTKNLRISPKAHLAFDYHLYLDRAQEESRGNNKIETTKRGIGPTYMDKAERIGLQARLLLDPERCLEHLERVLEKKRRTTAEKVPEFDVDFYKALVYDAHNAFKDLIVDTEPIIHEHLNKGHRFTIEGAHGSLLDLDHGTYPMVTSSTSTAGGLLVGAGMPPLRLSKVVGIFKAYQTRVGAGGMPTELKNELGDKIREKGHEYGTTTGRPRRVGYFDGVAARYAHMINGFTDIAITRLDTLSDVGDLKVTHEYQIDGKTIAQFPVDDPVLADCRPVYEDFTGWGELSASTYEELPKATQDYCQAIMKSFDGANMSFLGIGPARDDLIVCS